MASQQAQRIGKLLAVIIIFIGFFIMGMQFTELRFTSKETLIGPIIIIFTVLTYHLLFDRKLNGNRNNILVFISLIIFAVYYMLNINGNNPLKMEYILYFLIIISLFSAIIFFSNRIISKSSWIIFVFFYANLLFLPMLLSITNFNAANSNGIIAFLLLFFCLINLKEKNKILSALNLYNTVLLIITLFTATSRAAMMAFFIVIIMFIAIKYIYKYNLYIVAALIFLSPVITGVYIYLKYTSIGETLNKLSVEVTGKIFFSGRDTIWEDAVNTVIQKGTLLTGLGNNTEFGKYGGYLHNLYVQVFYQSGIIGFFLIGIFLLTLTYVISKTAVIDFDFRILFGYFIAILFLQVFEGHLIYKFEIISVLIWVIIAFLIRKSSQKLWTDKKVLN